MGAPGGLQRVLVFFLFTHNKKNLSLQFGFKKWKSHVTARPWEDRSEIVKELYSDLNVIRGSGGGVALGTGLAGGSCRCQWCQLVPSFLQGPR